MRILALSGMGSNLGDQAIAQGFLRLLAADADSHSYPVDVDLCFLYETRIDESNIDAVREHYDAVILAGGGSIYHRPDDDTIGGWGFDVDPAVLDRMPPYAVTAVGYNHVGDEPHFPERTAAHLTAVMNGAESFTFRDLESQSRVANMVLTPSTYTSATPDMAIHVRPRPEAAGRLDWTRPTVAVCLRLDRARERVGDIDRYVNTVGTALRTLHRSGHQILYVTHLRSEADDHVLEALREHMSVTALHEEVPELYRQASLANPDILAGVYRWCSVVLGQRMHSLVIPWAVGTPVVRLTSSVKTSDWVADYLGCRLPLSVDVRTAEPDEIVRKAERGIESRGTGPCLVGAERVASSSLMSGVLRLLGRNDNVWADDVGTRGPFRGTSWEGWHERSDASPMFHSMLRLSYVR